MTTRIKRILDAIESAGQNPSLIERLNNAEREKQEVQRELAILNYVPNQLSLIPTADDIKHRIKSLIAGTSVYTNPEFGRVMRSMIPSMYTLLYRTIDGGKIVSRAHLKIDLSPLLDRSFADQLQGLATGELTVDLFVPSRRVRYRKQVMERWDRGLSGPRIASELSISLTDVHRARTLDAMMKERQLSDPFELLTEPPARDEKLKRVWNRRFIFRPREGFPLWTQDPKWRQSA